MYLYSLIDSRSSGRNEKSSRRVSGLQGKEYSFLYTFGFWYAYMISDNYKFPRTYVDLLSVMLKIFTEACRQRID